MRVCGYVHSREAFCPSCYSIRRGREASPADLRHHKQSRRKKGLRCMFVNKPSPSGPGGQGVPCKGLLEMRETRPAIAEYLSLLVYPDGSDRTPSTLLVLIENGRFKLCLSDRDTGRSLWVTAESIEEGIASLDEDLQLGTADWRRAANTFRRK